MIGRHTAFTYKGKAVDLKKIGRELNIRYVLEGSVQRAGNRVRINVQLIDAATGNHLWADRFDKPIADLFDMQDEVVSRLANALNAQLIEAEARRAERSLHPDAMDLVFQGWAWHNKGLTPEYMTQARGFFERALAINPQSVEALVGMARVDLAMGTVALTDDRAARYAAAEPNAIKAVSLAPDHARAHLILGNVYVFTNRAAQGIAECEQALALDRNLARAHGIIGIGKLFMGRAAETESHIREAFRLSPRDIFSYIWMQTVGWSKILLGADAEAVGWLQRSIEANRNNPVVHFHLAGALALLVSLDEATAAAQAGLALNPNFTIRRWRDTKASDNPAYLAAQERIFEGLRLAGVPEG